MLWSDIPFDPSPRILRQFAATAFVVFGGLAAHRALERHDPSTAIPLAALSLAFAIAGLFAPHRLRIAYVASAVAAFPIGWLVSWFVLGVVYYGVFTPVALAFRLIGRDPLSLRSAPRESYWTPKATPADPARYLRQY